MSTWVVTGSYGQLGTALVAQLEAAGARVFAADQDTVDIAERSAVDRLLADLPEGPRIVVNAAAFTHVDRCEREPEVAERANALGPAVLAAACRDHAAQLVHVSTDYVFAGDGHVPYRETDPPDPRSVYGRTKLAGERAVQAVSDRFLVVRTSWVFGRGRNFLAAILEQARQRRAGEATGPLRVVADQRGRPTHAGDLATALRTLVEADARGLYHVANAGEATWWDLARFCLDETGHQDLEILAIRTDELPLAAPRPAWSVLDCRKAEAAGVRMRSWQDAVRAWLRSDEAPPTARGGTA